MRERVRAGPERKQNRIDEGQTQQPEKKAGNKIEHNNVAERPRRAVHVFPPHADGTDRSPADAHQHPERKGEIHDRKGHRQAGKRQRPHPAADEHAVHNIIEEKTTMPAMAGME